MTVARRLGMVAALVVVIVLMGAGLALLVAGGLLGLGIAVVDASRGSRSSLQAPGVVGALGAELIAAALLLGSRVGARISTEEDDGRDPVAG